MGKTSREGEIFGLLYEKFKAVSFFVYDMKKGKQVGGAKTRKTINGTARLLGT